MTPTDPELVTRIRLWAHQLQMQADFSDLIGCQQHAADLRAVLEALDTARQRDAELEAGALELSGALNKALTRERLLCDQLDAAEARVQQLEAALQERCAVWLANADESDSGLKATIYRECADEIDAMVGRAATQEPAHED